MDAQLNTTVTILDASRVCVDVELHHIGEVEQAFENGRDYLVLGVRGMCDQLVVVDGQGRVLTINYDDELMLIND